MYPIVYYGVYTDDGVSASKAPVDPEEVWVSRLDLDLIPPPLSVASLIHFISVKEGITGCSQLFVDKDMMTPLKDDHILTEQGHWPGSTPGDHVMFKSTLAKKCTGFLTGKFHICSVATSYHLVLNHAVERQGNFIGLWTPTHCPNPVRKLFYIRFYVDNN